MRRRLLVSVVVLSCVVTAGYGQSADAVAHRAVDMLGGSSWEKARYLAFTFNVERDGKNVASWAQRLDRYSGDYRVSGKQKGDDIVVVMNTNTKQGKAWKNGQLVADPAELLTFGYRRFINDTYWLLMPLKSLDPGVHREYAGEKTGTCGQTYDVVKLSFDKVGLTPGDNYWMWVNRDTGLVDEWHMKLEGDKPEDPPTPVIFHDFKRVGGLLISTRREIKGGTTVIRLDDVVVSESVPSGAFQ